MKLSKGIRALSPSMVWHGGWEAGESLQLLASMLHFYEQAEWRSLHIKWRRGNVFMETSVISELFPVFLLRTGVNCIQQMVFNPMSEWTPWLNIHGEKWRIETPAQTDPQVIGARVSVMPDPIATFTRIPYVCSSGVAKEFTQPCRALVQWKFNPGDKALKQIWAGFFLKTSIVTRKIVERVQVSNSGHLIK